MVEETVDTGIEYVLEDHADKASQHVLDMIEAISWTWARTYADYAPHWYIVRRKHPVLFKALASVIDRYGERHEFRHTGTFNRYLRIGAWKYWHYKIILNRTRVEWF